jgi:hypothetical protein
MAFRSSTGLAGTTGTTAPITVPAGGLSGDIGVVVLYIETTAAVTVPDGTWSEDTPALIANEGAGSGRMRRFYSRSPALSGTWTFSWTGSAYRSGAAALISGRTGTGSPFGTATTVEAAGTSGFTLAAVTAAAGDDLLVLATLNSTKTLTNTGGTVTSRQDNDEVYIGTIDALSAGSTGSKSWTSSASGDVHAWMAPVLLSTGAAAYPYVLLTHTPRAY